MKKNLFKKFFGLLVMVAFVLVAVACGETPVKAELSFEKAEVTVEVGDTFQINTKISGVDASTAVEYSFDKEGFVEYKDGKFTALQEGTVTVTGTLKGYADAKASIKVVINKKKVNATIDLKADKLEGYPGDDINITATVNGDVENKALKFEVDCANATYADGKLHLVAIGKVTLKATLEADPTITASIVVEVKEKPSTIKITPSATTIGVGAKATVAVEKAPEDAVVVWTSSDENVATVTDGVVTAIKAGTATIKAQIEGKDVSDEFVITVQALVTKIEATYEATMNAYDMQTIVVTVTPEDAADKTYTIKSSNEDVIYASNDGTLTGLAGGTATITITANDGSGVKYEFEVTVVEEVVEYSEVLCDPAVENLAAGTEYEYNGVVYIVKENAFDTLERAIEVSTNKVYVAKGNYDNLVIDKDGIELIGPNAGVNPATITRVDEAIFTGTIDIAEGKKNIKISGFAFTGAGGVNCNNSVENIEITYNNVYNTNAATSDWVDTRVELEAIFDFWFTAGYEGKNITCSYNKFDNIEEPGIFVARAYNVTCNNNVFHNFKRDAIRVDGGYNYGAWLFDSNEFVNDTLQGYNGIYLQSVSGKDDENGVQTITITNNKFENIGNTASTSSYICAIAARTYQEKGLKANILYNTFTNCINYFNFRNNGATSSDFELNINYNKFVGVPTGVYHRNCRPDSTDTATSNPVLANMDYNLFLDATGTVITDLTPYADKFVDVASYKDNFQTKEAYEAKLKELTGVSYDYIVNAAWKDTAAGTKVEGDGFTWTFGTNAFASINSCLAALESGATIKVLAGTYDEAINITLNNVTLLGPNAGVNARYINREAEAVLMQVVTIKANVTNFVIDGFELQGAAGINPEKDVDGVTVRYCVMNGTSQDGVVRSSTAVGEYVSNVKFIGNYSNNYKAWRVLHLTYCHGLEATNNYFECTSAVFDFLNVQGLLDGTVVVKDNTFKTSAQSFLYVKFVGTINATIQGNTVENVANTIIDFRTLSVPGSNNVFTITNNTFKNSGAGWCPIRIRTAGYTTGDSITIICNYNKFIDSYYNEEGTLIFCENPSLSTQSDPFKVIYNMDYNYFEVEGESYSITGNENFSNAAISWDHTYTNASDMPEYNVETETKPTSVQITNKISTMNAYETYQITFKVSPDDATNKKVGFTSSNTDAATVSSAGVINAKSGGTTTITVFSMADQTILDTMEIVVSPKSRIELRCNDDGLLVVGGENTATIEATYYGEDATQLTFTSSDPTIATVSETGVVTGIKAGSVIITATQAGKTATIGFTVIEGELTGLLKVLAEANHATIWNQDITYIGSDDGSADYTHNIYGSANDYYAGTIPTVTKNMLSSTAPNYETKTMKSIEFIVVHDTAGSPSSSTAYANSHWCTNSSNTGSSWHYTIGNDGIYQQLDDNRVAWHAGDGTGWADSTTLYDTGIAYEGDRPTVTIGDDNYFYINGKKSNIQSPSETEKKINTLGMVCVKGANGNYFMPTTWVCTQFGSYVCARGGNLNGIGIETAVNMGSDVYLTWQYTAKYIAQLLVKYDLLPDRVWFHNNFTNKNCPNTMITSDRVSTFLDLVYTEYNVLKNYSDYTITFTSSNPEILDNTGRVVKTPEYTTNVSYTITITKGSDTQSITLNTLVIGQYNF